MQATVRLMYKDYVLDDMRKTVVTTLVCKVKSRKYAGRDLSPLVLSKEDAQIIFDVMAKACYKDTPPELTPFDDTELYEFLEGLC